MKIDLDTACDWLLANAMYSQDSMTDEFDDEDLAKRFREAMEKETICEKLCMEAKIGDVFKYKGKTFRVEEFTGENCCEGCIFSDPKESCVLLTCDCVTPCGAFNNNIGKSVYFKPSALDEIADAVEQVYKEGKIEPSETKREK